MEAKYIIFLILFLKPSLGLASGSCLGAEKAKESRERDWEKELKEYYDSVTTIQYI